MAAGSRRERYDRFGPCRHPRVIWFDAHRAAAFLEPPMVPLVEPDPYVLCVSCHRRLSPPLLPGVCPLCGATVPSVPFHVARSHAELAL